MRRSSSGSVSSKKDTRPPPPPPPPKAMKKAVTPKKERSYSIQAQDLTNPDLKPCIELDPGWIIVWSRSQKRWYFFNGRANRSVWEWPPPKV